MVEPKVIQKQLKDINFGTGLWNQAEIRELPRIIHQDEVISECVSGMYEGGVALLVATEERLLLIDKKPLRYLTVEDFRFDMISEIDFSHRLMSASITISTGSKTLMFRSYNQNRLRHLISLVQEHMSSGKKDQAASVETQQQHLEEINRQLQVYLMAQHQHLMQMQQNGGQQAAAPAPKLDPQLSDYLLAQRLVEQYKQKNPDTVQRQPDTTSQTETAQSEEAAVTPAQKQAIAQEAKQEIFGGQRPDQNNTNPTHFFTGIEINPIKVAYSRLPMMLRNRKFGRPSLHAHSKEENLPTGRQTIATYSR